MEPDTEAVYFGKSVIVPSVQELTKHPLDKIPTRYSQPLSGETDTSHLSVPVIDLQVLAAGDSVTIDSELQKLHSACSDWGFFQELAKDPLLTKVPPHYVRHGIKDPSLNPSSTSPYEVPVIDMNKLLLSLSDNAVDSSELEKLHLACKEWGFFQMINHGVSSSVMKNVKEGVEWFFNLSVEEKNKFAQKPGEVEGYGQTFVVSDQKGYDWSDIFMMNTLPTHLRKPHLLPNLPNPFRDSLDAYSLELQTLAHKLLRLMAKALKMNPVDMRQLFEQGRQSVKMNYYPPCPEPDLVLGVNRHSDATGLTILLQINDVEGLQIVKDDKWVSVQPIPNAFVVNIGDVLEIVTNGIYRSIEHRVVVNSNIERMSLATFYNPKPDGEVGPAPSLISKETPALFRRIGVADFYKGFFNRELLGKYLDTLRIHN